MLDRLPRWCVYIYVGSGTTPLGIANLGTDDHSRIKCCNQVYENSSSVPSILLQVFLFNTSNFLLCCSVRVSNELGAGRSKAAKFSVEVAVTISTLIGVVFVVAVISTKNHYPRLFSGKPEVIHEISKLAYFLAATIFLMRIQPILHGVAVGAGWQYSVVIVNIICYYIVGLPLGACLGYIANIGVKGIWIGMLCGYLASNSSFDIQNVES
ncbi:putative transcription factor RADIALIS-like [Capsicum annuum]|nr:putative transcription factor RADIALIS-like [Capsicum annuum]